ncbi:uncharacterized protein LOC103187471 [Callorhinchus milii]|uniref:uncharacterized protein LOC103187471 n=1 Tax=Callorhinchus milii TaxID=7868 RepID=UPI001C3F8CBD|nr:uncharacterized protein LOC103187471 [Callorhinchus milii]
MVIRRNHIQMLTGFLLFYSFALSTNAMSYYNDSLFNDSSTDSTTLFNMTDYNTTWSSETNTMVTLTALPPNFSCQTFNCTGSMCYEDYNKTGQECPASSMFCQLYRISNSSYWGGCHPSCVGTEGLCGNSSLDMCMMECCNTTLCLMLNGDTQYIEGLAE